MLDNEARLFDVARVIGVSANCGQPLLKCTATNPAPSMIYSIVCFGIRASPVARYVILL